MTNKNWKIFQGQPDQPHERIKDLPPAPSWRTFDEKKGE